MKKFFCKSLICTVMFSCYNCFADPTGYSELKDSAWSNGNEIYYYEPSHSNDGEYFFNGGTVHEGGSYFKLTKLIKEGNKVLGGEAEFYDDKNDATLQFIKDQNGVTKQTLVFKTKSGHIVEAYVPLSSLDEEDSDYFANLKMFNEASVFETLKGLYGDDSGYKIEFTYEELAKNDPNYDVTCTFHYGCGTRYVIRVNDGNGWVSSPAKFNYDYDFATTTFKLPNEDKLIFVSVTPQGIDLYNADQEFIRLEPKIKSLKYIAHDVPRFSYASERILPLSFINRFDHEVQELIRNEIFARHGYKFKRDDLNQYFSEQNWYHPKDQTDELSEIEKFNIKIIKIAEAKK